jgi:cold shock protein
MQIGDQNGAIYWTNQRFNNAKGYGFVGRDGGPDDFDHFSSIQADGYKALKEGDAFQFDVIEGHQDPRTHETSKPS